MVLGRPQHVVAEAIHELRHVARGGEGLPQAFRGIAPVVGGRAGAADIVELDLADIEHMEVFDHRAISPASKLGTKSWHGAGKAGAPKKCCDFLTRHTSAAT